MEAGTVPEKVTISYRGAKYELGRGKRYYAIWEAGAQPSGPVDRWPETREGWTQAWARFTAIEAPGTITKVDKRRKWTRRAGRAVHDPESGRAGGRLMLAAAALLGLGVVLGVIGLFPGYLRPQSLASQAEQLVPHLIYLVAWAASGVCVLFGAFGAVGVFSRASARPEVARFGALLGTGVSAVTLGLFLADLGEVISGGSALLGAGLVLTLLSWLACAAGSVIALTARTRAAGKAPSGPAKPRLSESGPIALVLLAAIGAVAAFVPAWDSFTLSDPATGATQTITAGNAFSSPGAVLAGDIVVIIAVIGFAVLAALWRPVRQGAVLLAGATVPLAAQAISALIQVSEPVSPAQFGISADAGVSITSGVTPIFWVYCVFVISLVVSCAWMLTAPQYPAMPEAVAPPAAPAAPQPPQDVDDEAEDSDSGTGDSDDGAEDDAKSTYA